MMTIIDGILNFNPIIGLILTRLSMMIMSYKGKFQSHYRSDFNDRATPLANAVYEFQSHYRSDFNTRITMKYLK